MLATLNADTVLLCMLGFVAIAIIALVRLDMANRRWEREHRRICSRIRGEHWTGKGEAP